MGIPVSIAASTIHTTPAPTAPASLWNPVYFKHLLVSGKCSVQMKTMKTMKGLYFVFFFQVVIARKLHFLSMHVVFKNILIHIQLGIQQPHYIKGIILFLSSRDFIFSTFFVMCEKSQERISTFLGYMGLAFCLLKECSMPTIQKNISFISNSPSMSCFFSARSFSDKELLERWAILSFQMCIYRDLQRHTIPSPAPLLTLQTSYTILPSLCASKDCFLLPRMSFS